MNTTTENARSAPYSRSRVLGTALTACLALTTAGCSIKADLAAENDRAGDAAVAALTSIKGTGAAATTAKPSTKPGPKPASTPPTTKSRPTTTRRTTTTKPLPEYDESYAQNALPPSGSVFGDAPMTGKSASRDADGMVLSAGGYVAKTPMTAHGMLLEPKWGPSEQPVADMLHRYIDETFQTLTDGEVSASVTSWMESVQRPDPGSAIYATNDDELIDPMGRIKTIANQGVEYRAPGAKDSYVMLRWAKVTGANTASDPRLILWKACERSDYTLYRPSDPTVTGGDRRSVLYEIVTMGIQDPKILRFEATAIRTDGGGHCGE